MTGPIDVTPSELREFARRVTGHAGSIRECTPGDSLADVRSHLPTSSLAGAAESLAGRVRPSVSRLAGHLDGIAERTREATDVLVDTDAGNASAIGGR